MKTEPSEKLVYTIDEVAKLLNCSRNLAYKLARQNKLPGVIFLGLKRMVISAAAIDRVLNGNGEKAEN